MSNFFDFNSAPAQTSGDLLPAKTFAKVILKIRPGQHGDEGWVTKSASGFEYLAMDLTIVSAPYAKRKIFQNSGVGGVTDGHEKAAEISRSLIRAMLESARGIDPKDESDKAHNKRVIRNWGEVDGLEFAIEIGIEKGKDGYEDKNKVVRAITPDHKYYKRIMNGETIMPDTLKVVDSIPQAAVASASKPATAIPAWAR